MSNVRKRKRSVKAVTGTTTSDLDALAVRFYTENKKKNAADRAATKARKELLTAMQEKGLKTKDLECMVDGKEVKLTAKVATGTKTVIDIKKLKGLVDERTFMAIISASQTSVEKFGGKHIATQCSTTVAGSTNVSVNPTK